VSTKGFINGNLKEGLVWSLDLDKTQLGWIKLKPFDTIGKIHVKVLEEEKTSTFQHAIFL
jgi:hypothetical protein